jgi:peroxiredoxin
MSTLQTRYAERGLRVVAVNLDKQRELADAFIAERSTPFTVAFDPAGQTARAYQVAAMPSSFLIGRDGRLIARHAGFEAGHVAKLEQQIEEALSR